MADPVDAPYVDCATTSTYTTPTGFTLPTGGWTASVTSVLAWQEDGEFTVREEPHLPPATIKVPTAQVLADGLKLLEK